MQEEGRICQQCDEPLTEERKSPNDPEMDELMCASCEVEHIGRGRRVRVV